MWTTEYNTERSSVPSSMSKWRKGKTMIQLYDDREKTGWYWRLLGVLSASIILLGFLIFPTSFNNTLSSQSGLSIAALILLALGYSLSVALWFTCTSTLFQLDVLFLPCLLSCVLGLLNVGITLGVNPPPSPQSHWNTASISALTLALTSGMIYGGLTLYTFRKVQFIRTSDKNRNSDSETMHLIPEDEQQRQQLLRLLLAKENETRTSTSQHTYWIDLPDPLKNGRDSMLPGANNNMQTGYSVQMPYPTASNNYESQRRRSGSNPMNERVTFLRSDSQRAPETSPKSADLQRLEKARERTQPQEVVRSRDSSASPVRPTLMNARSTISDAYNTPLSERHPLERQGFIQAATVGHPKDLEAFSTDDNDFSQISPAAYTQASLGNYTQPLLVTYSQPPSLPRHDDFSRPEEENYSYQGSEEGRRIERELENRGRLQQQASFESQQSQGLVAISKGMSGGRGSFGGHKARRTPGGSGGGSGGQPLSPPQPLEVSEEEEEEEEQMGRGNEQLTQYEIARGRRRRDTAEKGLPLEAVDTAPRIIKVRTSDEWREREW
ncbi:MAG: hypothetical protein MMC33_009951 [Icmadophila ericetorum]|nr:hypothetical protein [Icmadophila ericetorum]